MRYIPSVYDMFDDMFDDFFNDSWTPVYSNRDVMRTDIHEKDGQYLLEVELPGYSKEDIKLDLKDGYLTISASHGDTKEDKDSKGNVIRSERSFGSASRSFYVGKDVKSEDIKARFNNGILELSVPNTKQPKVENTSRIMIE